MWVLTRTVARALFLRNIAVDSTIQRLLSFSPGRRTLLNCYSNSRAFWCMTAGYLTKPWWECQQALCNQHHLRELTYLLEEQGPSLGRRHDGQKYQREVRDLRALYDAILAQAQAENPITPSTGKRGRPKQSKATNLIGRLRDYSDVWRFMTQADVPFTNNLAEQTVRMPKVKQKVSGCFRTPLGATNYCVIRSYCATMQGANIFDSLVAAFQDSPPQPCFA
jgi:transposase